MELHHCYYLEEEQHIQDLVILLIVNESSTCNICQGTFMVELLVKIKLIIWNEAPMINRFCLKHWIEQ